MNFLFQKQEIEDKIEGKTRLSKEKKRKKVRFKEDVEVRLFEKEVRWKEVRDCKFNLHYLVNSVLLFRWRKQEKSVTTRRRC